LEADWEFEVGGDAPVIDACWPGFVDLRWTPEHAGDLSNRVRGLQETTQLPALVATLERLNSQRSPVWTSKCDFWPALEPGEFDSDELDAPSGWCTHAMGCYIDVLPKSDQQWQFPGMVAAACKHVCAVLHAVPLRNCRVDLIIRRAMITPDLIDRGITAYITACGPTASEAKDALEDALHAIAHAICPDSTLQ
jgi:hypothetical protein